MGLIIEEKQLRRGLKNRHIQFIALGFIIDSGYFLGNSYAIEKAGPLSILGYLLGGIIVMMVMLCYRELMIYKPITGSFITYTKELVSSTWACGIGWCYWLQCVTPSEPIAAGMIMNLFMPRIGTVWWAVFFCLFVTILNLFKVEAFGEAEFWLSLTKVGAIIVFSILSVFIGLGWIGAQGYIGIKLLLGDGGFAPKGWFSVFLVMMIVLGNYQGAETIGLTAGESKNPQKSLPKAIKNVTNTIIGLYTIPIFLLLVIFPWRQAAISENAFSEALVIHGFRWLGSGISFIILITALSAANSDMYACSRILYSLQKEGFAPKFLGKLNIKNVPQNATIMSNIIAWVFLVFYVLDKSGLFYEHLLLLSGFAGEIVWISICIAQFRFRKKYIASGHNIEKLRNKTPYFPYLTWLAILTQAVCLLAMLFSQEMRDTLIFGMLTILLSSLIYYGYKKKWGTRLAAIINTILFFNFN